MKCFSCRKEIKNESEMVSLGGDGDFVCNEKCKLKHEKDKKEFFDNIDKNEWYHNKFFKI